MVKRRPRFEQVPHRWTNLRDRVRFDRQIDRIAYNAVRQTYPEIGIVRGLIWTPSGWFSKANTDACVWVQDFYQRNPDLDRTRWETFVTNAVRTFGFGVVDTSWRQTYHDDRRIGVVDEDRAIFAQATGRLSYLINAARRMIRRRRMQIRRQAYLLIRRLLPRELVFRVFEHVPIN